MDNSQIDLFLFKAILFCFGMIFLLFIIRTIKILRTKKIEGIEDLMCVIFWIAFLLPFVIAYFFIKQKFKKESDKQIKEEYNGIEDVFKM